MFFDLEKSISDDLAVIAAKASADSEHVLVVTDKQLQLCDTYSSEDSVIANIIANKEIGMHYSTRTCFIFLLFHYTRFVYCNLILY